GMVMTIMFTMFRTANRSYIRQDYVAEMQQNLRVAMYYVARDVRMAGCGLNLFSGLVPNIQIFNDTDSAWHFVLPITGANSAVGPDTFTVFYGDIKSGAYDASITGPMPDASAELNVDAVASFKEGNTVIVTNGITATLFVVSEVQAAALKLQHNPAASVFNPPAAFKAFPAGAGYGTGSLLFNFGASVWVTYAINQSDPLHPRLIADYHDGTAVRIIADNIEDMQLHYFLNDGSEVDNPVGFESKIQAVRINVVARVDKQDFEGVIFKPLNLEDRVWLSPPDDGFRRRVLSTIARLRNM
ncbi:MAG: PilW family protein, partial [Pseudomonadota bacterium]